MPVSVEEWKGPMLLGAAAWSAVTIVVVWLGSRKFALPMAPSELQESQHGLNAKEVLEKRLARFETDRQRFEQLKLLLAIFLVIGISFLVGSTAGETKMQCLGVELPVDTLHVLLPAGLVFAWGRLGFVLHQLINTRRALVVSMRLLGNDGDHPTKTLIPLLRDNGLVDSYFANKDPEHFPDHAGSRAVAFVLMLAYASFLAAVHAVAVAAPLAAAIRSESGAAQCWLTVLTLVTAAYFTITHYEFARTQGSRLLQCVVIVIAAAMTFVLIEWTF